MSQPAKSARRKSSRTFTGCLTCRRRKVKCPGPARPCQMCHRLRLECVSSFSSNLRPVAVVGRLQIPQHWEEETQIPRDTLEVSAPLSLPWDSVRDCDASFSLASISSEERRNDIAETWHPLAPSWGHVWDDTALLGMLPSNDDNPAALDMLSLPTPATSQTPTAPWPSSTAETSSTSDTGYLSFLSGIASSDPAASPHPSQPVYTLANELHPSLYPGLMGSNLGQPSPETTWTAVNYFKTSMATTLSVKNVKWNMFTYLVNISHPYKQSAIKSSIIALAAAHQAAKRNTALDEHLTYYAHASIELDHLLHSLQGLDQLPVGRMDMVLATAYLLSHCDIVTCNTSNLALRLQTIRNLVQSRWNVVGSQLSGMGARLILWLGYLDTRRSLLSLDKDTLLDVISRQETLPLLYGRSRLYLREAFGETYPSSELRDDMIQDPVNLKFAHAMAVLGQILRKACTEHEVGSGECLDELYTELSELKRETDIALQGFQTTEGSVMITRTSYHWMNLKIINNTSFILLSRARSPAIRVDKESQNAAYEILASVMKLRNSGMLHNPHTVFFVFPIFLAGIETVDEVHQDWIARFLEDVGDWGLHVQKASQFMSRILEVQKQIGARVTIREITKLASEQIIL